MRLNNVQGCSQVLKNFKQNYSGDVLQVLLVQSARVLIWQDSGLAGCAGASGAIPGVI
jgi:hypothetical protein